jgi:hypothetical protein
VICYGYVGGCARVTIYAVRDAAGAGGKERRDRYRQAVWQALRPGRCTGVTQMPHVNKTVSRSSASSHPAAYGCGWRSWDRTNIET